MKKIITIFGILITSSVLAAPIECHNTKMECESNLDKNLDCYVAPQSFCDSLLTKYQANESAKYKIKLGNNPPADYFDYATTNEALGSANFQKNPPPIPLFVIFGTLIVGVLTYLGLRKNE